MHIKPLMVIFNLDGGRPLVLCFNTQHEAVCFADAHRLTHRVEEIYIYNKDTGYQRTFSRRLELAK